MATPVIMPRQGQSVESCIITEWVKKVGDTVNEGDVLFAYETDKAAFEEPAKVSGTLLAVFFHEDDDVPCLTNVAVIGNPGEDFLEFDPNGGTAAAAEEAAPEVKQEEVTAEAVVTAKSANGVSPRAKAAAEKLGVDASQAAPTGPHGRVIERDVIELAKSARTGTGIAGRVTVEDLAAPVETVKETQKAAAVVEAEYEDKKLSNIRKVIARSMHESLSNMAQLTHNSSFDATEIMAYRKKIKAAQEKLGVANITVNDIIIYAVSRTLKKHPDLNAHFLGDHMRYFKHVHVGFAVDTPRGLLVPTVFNADTKSLEEIAVEAKTLAAQAQSGSIDPAKLTGASFTISNLGNFGVEHFTPIINPPQTGILGVDCIIERVRTKDGQIEVYPAMGLSLTYDHRAVDGAPASRFLMDMRVALENFTALLAK